LSYSLTTIGNIFSETSEEIFDSIILFICCALISWTVIWMNTHGRKFSDQAKNISNSVLANKLPSYNVNCY
jgi:hypothetical protein